MRLFADPVDGDRLVCSARGCRADADWGLLWNNPRIHTPERRKVWLACSEHLAYLTEYLGVRSFLKDTVPADSLPRVGAAEDDPSDGT